MRILAAGDLHGDITQVKKLAKRAKDEHVDLVILCGDISDRNHKAEGMIGPFLKYNKRVIMVPGNHETIATADFLAELYGVKNIHGYSVKYENIGFFGAGGAINLPSFPGSITEKELFETLKKANSHLKGVEKKIMITHMHPSGSISEFSGIKGSKSITNAIKQFRPDILIHGHIHEAAGLEQTIGKTRVINVDNKGKIIEI